MHIDRILKMNALAFLVLLSFARFAISGCAADRTTGSVYCGAGDCATDGSTGTVYCSRIFGGGSAMDRSTKTVYCGAGACAADLSTGTVYCAKEPNSGAAADLTTGTVYCADSTGMNPSPLNCARGSVSACKIR
jgi:hypothetical protein